MKHACFSLMYMCCGNLQSSNHFYWLFLYSNLLFEKKKFPTFYLFVSVCICVRVRVGGDESITCGSWFHPSCGLWELNSDCRGRQQGPLLTELSGPLCVHKEHQPIWV